MACANEEQRIGANRRENDDSSRRIVKGLMNLGNTCFFNSVLQNLLSVNGLRDHFMKPTQFSEGPITSALRKLYVETSLEGSDQGDNFLYEFPWFNKGNLAVNPDDLFNSIVAKVPQFRGNRQQDSHELLRCLLDNLQTEELQSLSNSKPTNCGDGEAAEGNIYESSNQRNNLTLVDRVFQGQLCSTICCSKCGYQSVTYETFHDLSLSISSEPEHIKVSRPHQKDPSSSKTQWKNDEDTTFKPVFGLLGGCWFPLSYKEIDSNAAEEDEVTQLPEELNTANAFDDLDELDVSVGLPLNDDIFHIFDDNESSEVQENKIDVSESKSHDNLFKGISDITETREEDRKAAVIPMSVEGCLVEFTRPEILCGDNGWKCPNCASKLVNGSDNLENTTEKEEHGMRSNGRLNAGSCSGAVLNDAQGVSCSDAEMSEIDGINNAERPAPTSSEEEGARISADLGEWDLESEIFTSSGEGHRLKKRRSKTVEHEANSNGILQEATKRYLISKTPPTLTIHLKRFKHGLFGRLSKLNAHVHFQETLDLTPYMDSRSPDKDNCIYRLIGVVRHEGLMSFGHYVAYVRCDQDGSGYQWFHVSDSRVKEVSLSEVLKSEAYILFYEKCEL